MSGSGYFKTSTNFLNTSSLTSFAGAVRDIPRGSRSTLNFSGGGTTVATGGLSEINWTGAAITGTGHIIGQLNLVHLTSNNAIALAIGTESRFHRLGTGSAANVYGFTTALQTVAEGALKDIAVFADLYCQDFSNAVTYGTVGSTARYNLVNVDSGKIFYTNGIMINGGTGMQIPSADICDPVAGRYYFPYGWGSSATAALTKDLGILTPPFKLAKRTQFSKIGINVTGGIASSNIRLGIISYNGGSGLPYDTLYDSGNISSATTGDKESSTALPALDPGIYSLYYQNTGGASGATVRTIALTDAQLIEFYGNGSSNPAAATIEDFLYIANTGAIPDPITGISRLRVGAIPAIYLKA